MFDGYILPIEEMGKAMHEECGIFGVWAPGHDVARMTCFGLQALQHRGQESAGIAVGNGRGVCAEKDLGLVTQVFDEASLSALKGDLAIGHVRYSTSGGSGVWEMAQPHMASIDDVPFALAHNGTLTNTEALRARLDELKIPLMAGTDSEIAAKLIAHLTLETNHLREGIARAMDEMRGAYAMVICTADALYGFRDPYGIRPLCLGRLPQDGGWVLSSETCGLDIVGAQFVREVAPGEIIRINGEGIVSSSGREAETRASCIFEYVYFARPDSVIDGQNVYAARQACGRILAKEAPVDADLVLGVPDSGVPAALGFSNASGVPYADGIVKNRYVGRTFIQPTQEMRQLGIRLKLNPLPDVIRGKRLVVIDDSVVRGNTSKKLVAMLRAAGAAEVHLRITSPEILWPCYYGIDTDTREQLIAANMTLDEMRQWMGADSLAFLSLEGLRAAVAGVQHPGFCEACFTGIYPE